MRSLSAFSYTHLDVYKRQAQDWTEMLYRMYTRWAERHGFTYQLLDYEDGDEDGIKSASILIEGDNAYGYLKDVYKRQPLPHRCW